MAFPNWALVIIEFYILTHLAVLTITHGDSQCGNRGTFTPNSTYEKLLDDTLSVLTQRPNENGFFTATSNSSQVGETNTVYAVVLCLGDFEVDRCLACLKSAPERLKTDCPYQKRATGWYFETCMFSYSNTTFDVVDSGDKDVLYFPASGSVNNSDSVNETLGYLFKRLRGTAVDDDYTRKYYSDNTALQNSRGYIRATMQCLPDVSKNICESCLVNASDYLNTSYNGSVDGVVYYGYSCLLKYEIIVGNNIADPPNPSQPFKPSQGKNRSKVFVPAVTMAAVILTILILFLCLMVRRIYTRKGEEEDLFEVGDDDTTGEMIYFRLKAVKAATRNFSGANKLGEGGFGPVYWGILTDGKKIAVKRLSQHSGQGMREFKTEVKLIIKLQHKNLVKLLGCCMKGKERLLIYEYMSNSSLDYYLFEDPIKGKELDWAKRVNIVNGIAKGLRYLHEDSRLKIIHRDLKASNVLLDEEMNPKISDFGTARIFGSKQVEASTERVVGTYGYMAPEYAMEGLFSIKSDVYSFGVLLLEIISGKRNNRWFHQEHDKNLLAYAWTLWNQGKGEEFIDENLNDDCPVEEAVKWMRIALLCIEEDPNNRPTMSSVTFMLEGEWKSLSEPKPPMSLSLYISSDESSTTWTGDKSDFYSCTGTTSNVLASEGC